MVGVKQPIISGWINNKFNPSVENLIELSKILSVSVGCILDLEPIPEGYPDSHLSPPVIHIYNEETPDGASQPTRIPEPTQISEPTRIPEPTLAVAEPASSYRPKRRPFTEDQISFLDEWFDKREASLTDRIVTALREDSSLLKEPNA